MNPLDFYSNQTAYISSAQQKQHKENKTNKATNPNLVKFVPDNIVPLVTRCKRREAYPRWKIRDETKLLKLYKKYGNSDWEAIATHFTGKTELACRSKIRRLFAEQSKPLNELQHLFLKKEYFSNKYIKPDGRLAITKLTNRMNENFKEQWAPTHIKSICRKFTPEINPRTVSFNVESPPSSSSSISSSSSSSSSTTSSTSSSSQGTSFSNIPGPFSLSLSQNRNSSKTLTTKRTYAPLPSRTSQDNVHSTSTKPKKRISKKLKAM